MMPFSQKGVEPVGPSWRPHCPYHDHEQMATETRECRNGGPFVISFSTLPELIAEARGLSSVCRTAAIGCGVLGAGLVTIRIIKSLRAFRHRRRLR